MKELDKKKLLRAIDLNKKYYKSSDADMLDELQEAEIEAFGYDNVTWMSSLVVALILKSSPYYNEPNKTFYDVFEALGYDII